MEIDYDEQDRFNEKGVQQMKNPSYREFFQKIKNRVGDYKFPLASKDTNGDFFYIMSTPLLVLDSLTFEIVQRITVPERWKFDDPQRIINFYSNGVNYFLLYNQNSIFIPAPTSDKRTNQEMSVEQRLTFLRENDQIIKMHYVANDANIPYFAVISSNSKIHFIRLRLDKDFQEFDYTTEELADKSNFIRKLMSSFSASQETNKVFVLNPFNYSKFRKNNKKNNIIFLFNENYLKKIEFNVTSKSVEPEYTLQVNTSNMILDQLKGLHQNPVLGSVSIESADCFHDKTKKMNKIYFIVKYQNSIGEMRSKGISSHFYLFVLSVHHESNVVEMRNEFDFSWTHEKDSLQMTNRSFTVINKYKEEGYLVFSLPKSTLVYYITPENTDNYCYKMLNSETAGVNVMNNIENFSLDVLTVEDGAAYLYFKNGRINTVDKTDIFVNNTINPELKIDEELNENTGLRMSRPFFQTPDFVSKIESTENLEKIIQNAYSMFFQKATEGNYGNFKYNPSIIPENDPEILNFNKKLRIFDVDQIAMSMNKFLTNIIDDDTSNVDNINKESIKAELVIIQYLLQKEKHLDFFFDFLSHFKVLEKFDGKRTILLSYLLVKEKLTAAIRLREYENGIIDKKVGSESGLQSDKMNFFYASANNFFSKFYLYLKNTFSKLENEKPFTKHLVYSKITQIEVYLDNMFEVYKNLMEDLKTNKEEKVVYTYILLSIFNRIFASFRIIHENYFKDLPRFNIALFKDNIHYLWMLREDYMDFFKFLFYKLLDFQPFLKTLHRSDQFNSELMHYVDNILYFYDFFFKIHNSSENQKNFFELKKEILGKVTSMDPKRTLQLAKKYADFYTVTVICHSNQWIGDLLEYMKERRGNPKEIFYFLKLYLLLESDNIRNAKRGFEDFSYFEHFCEYKEEIREIVSKYPKINFLYEMYLKSKEADEVSERRIKIEDLTRSIVDLNNIPIFLKLAKIVNSLNKFNLQNIDVEGNEEAQTQVQQFLVENNNQSKEINFCLLVNYLTNSFKLNAVNTRDIFNSFENFITNFILINSNENLDSYIKFKISVQLVKLAVEINYKLNNTQEWYNNLITIIFTEAFKEDYVVINELMESIFKVNSVDSLSDEQRRHLYSKSISNYLLHYFPETRNNLEGVINQHKVMEVNDKENALKMQEYIHFLETLF